MYLLYQKRVININIRQIRFLGNFDETAIYFENIYNIFVQRKGKKSFKVRFFGKDKITIITVLSILANRFKFPPLLIFFGKTGGTKKKLQNNIIVLIKKYQVPRKCLD